MNKRDLFDSATLIFISLCGALLLFCVFGMEVFKGNPLGNDQPSEAAAPSATP